MSWLLLLLLLNVLVVNSYHNNIRSLSKAVVGSLNSNNVDIDVKNNMLCRFLEDAKAFNGVRHVVQGTGAILETAGSFSNLRYADVKDKGKLATLSSEEPQFECHIRLYEIREVKLIEIVKFERKLYVIRFLLDSGATALSSILMNTDDPNEIEKWNVLKEKYGNEFKV